MAGTWRQLRRTALRRKSYQSAHAEDTLLRRCLSRWDVSALGVGGTLGVGVHVLIGHVAMKYAGPSVVLSFLVAGVGALFAGLCFAELSARLPKAGAAYSYTHAALGEMVAFLIGWCNILEFVCGSASVARGISIHTDDIFNATMSGWFGTAAPIAVPYMLPYFDIFAFFIVITMGVMLSTGVREATFVNNIFSAANMVTILFIIAAGAFAADVNNWSIPLADVPEGHGKGGFFPFEVWGTLRGAALCFYGFVGFDSICAAGEEVKKPRRVIPMTIVFVILATLMLYASVAVVTTMMVPYYLQGPYLAVSESFSYVGWTWAYWVVRIGCLCGLFSGLFGAMFPLPRLLYSMSSDGLLVSWLSKLTACRQAPLIATAVPTLFIATIAGVFQLEALVETLCIGTLFSYTAVAASVVLMRYRSDYTPGEGKYLRQVFGLDRSPTLTSARVVYVSLVTFICIGITAALVLTQAQSPLIPSSVLHGLAMILVLIMAVQPQNKEDLPFKTPLVPLMPCLSIYFNIHLMVIINGKTWIRVGIWIAIGIIVYLLKFFCCKQEEIIKDNITIVHAKENGKNHVQIIVEAPTPPDTITRTSNYRGDIILEEDEIQEDTQDDKKDTVVRKIVPIETEDIVLHQAYIENNEEKEAKIIDLLDRVLQAEEDSYGEMISLKEVPEDVVSTSQETEVHRKSLSDLSDAGSDASLGNLGLSKYDIIAQVHREDLPRVNEEEEKIERENIVDKFDNEDGDEQITAFNDTDSRTDESGYSDTLDRNALSESLEESKEDILKIPVPPPLPDSTISYFIAPNFIKSYTIASKHYKPPSLDDDDDDQINLPRESVKSNSTLGEDNITFGSDRQVHFMSKLNNLFQTKITGSDDEEPRKRSLSTGNAVDNTEFSITPRPFLLAALQNEITSKDGAHNLRPVNVEEQPEEPKEKEENLSRQELKTKLEGIFAAGGPQLLKPRLMKSNPPTPEEPNATDTSSSESIPKLPKMEKNDTLKRQKDKFSAVLSSINRLSFKDDEVV